ncbi:MAG: 50S ribosomal protein L13 [Nanoarchaeota archaeon]
MTSELIINAENAVVGRLASVVAKEALLGKKIFIINSEKAVISGNMQNIVNDYKTLRKKGGSSQKGPLLPATVEGLLKRAIRGMLSHKQGRGKTAFQNIKCYAGIPKEFEGKESIGMGKKMSELKTKHGSKLGDIVKLLK